MDTLTILKKTRALIAEPGNWRRMIEADNRKKYAQPKKRDHRLDLDGALMIASGKLQPVDAYRALDFRNDLELGKWHDAKERKHSDVIARLDAAIQLLEQAAASEAA